MRSASRFAVLMLCAAGCDAASPIATFDLSGFTYDAAAPAYDFSHHAPPPNIPDMAVAPEDLARPTNMPPDMSGLTTGIPTIHCTADQVDGALATQSIYVPDGITDFVGLCDGWVAVADHNENQIDFFNPVTHQTGSPIVLDGSPGRLALDTDNDLLYATMSPAARIAKVDLQSGSVQYIDGVDVAMLAIGNGGQVLGVNRAAMGPPVLTVFDGASGTIAANIDLAMSTDGTLIAFDRARNLIVTAASGATSADPWFSRLNRFAFDPHALSVTFQESVPDVGPNGEDLLTSPDGLHTVFPCGKGNDGDYSLADYHTDDFSMRFGTWAIGPYPVSAAFSPDGRYLAANSVYQLQLWDASTHAQVSYADACYYSGSPYYRVRFSRGGKVAFLITSSCYEINGKNVGLLTYLTTP